MRKITIILIALSLITPAFAETIFLKSGKTIEGKLIERTDKYIKIDFEGVPLTYYFDEIEKVENSSLKTSPTEPAENIYVNEKYGIKMKGPKGWYINVIEQKIGAIESLAIFSKYSLQSKASPNPNINLVVSDISTLSITDPKECMEKSYLYLPSNTEIDIAPTRININDIDGAMASVIMHSNIGTQKSLQYCFIKNKFAFNISMVTRANIFNDYKEDFEESLNTFTFLTK